MKTNFHSWFHSFEFSLSKHVKLCTKEWVLCDDLAVMLLMVFFIIPFHFLPYIGQNGYFCLKTHINSEDFGNSKPGLTLFFFF